jgi:D-alanine transaminase
VSMVYLNGQFLPLEEARVPVLDRGFIFGDGVYEVIPVYQRRVFRLPQHLARLQTCMNAIALPNPHSAQQWQQLIERVVAYQSDADQSVYLQVTRGVAKRDHAFPSAVTPTVLIMSSPLKTPSREQVERGVSAISLEDNRWLRCDIKSIALLGNVLLRQAAVSAGAAECVLLRDGWLTEGAASNIFVVQRGVLLAPPKNNLILPGITYDVVLELARAAGLVYQVRCVSAAEVRSADELMLTSSSREILPVTLLDGSKVGDGAPGPVTRRLIELFQRYKQDLLTQAAVEPA